MIGLEAAVNVLYFSNKVENSICKISDWSFTSKMAEVILVKFTNDIKLGGKANALEKGCHPEGPG